ncbi:MAG: hypothetical protein ABEI52_05125 [Halobacteriaceae archaeon]
MPMPPGEQELTDKWLSEHQSEYIEIKQEVLLSDSTPTASRRADIVGVVSEDGQRVVDVLEVKEYLGPRAIGQILYYAKYLTDIQGDEVRSKGIIFEKERDDLSRSLAEKHEIKLVEM